MAENSPIDDPLRLELVAGKAQKAAEDARAWRESARLITPRSAERDELIQEHLSALAAAMRPLRSAIGRLNWTPQASNLERHMREASEAVQYERRQLKKMLTPEGRLRG